MQLHRYALPFLLAACMAGAAHADNDKKLKGVVELFTSQGCSSCPPADAALEKLIREGDVVGLAYHVDYWNYMGWQDTLASKENTERQYGYARTLGRNGVYTPQAVINGRDHINGAEIDKIRSRITDMSNAGEGLTVPVSSQFKDGEIRIDIGEGSGKADIVVAYFTRQQFVDVKKGENSGRRITYWHSVDDVQTVGMWNGSAMTVALPANVMTPGKKDGCAILLQTHEKNGDPASIIGASILYAGDSAANSPTGQNP